MNVTESPRIRVLNVIFLLSTTANNTTAKKPNKIKNYLLSRLLGNRSSMGTAGDAKWKNLRRPDQFGFVGLAYGQM